MMGRGAWFADGHDTVDTVVNSVLTLRCGEVRYRLETILIKVGCYIWYSDEGTGWGRSPPRLLLAVPNVTAHPSTASVPITVLLYSGPLLCGYNVSVKGY